MPRNALRPRTPLMLRRAAASLALMLAAFACVQCRPVHDTVTGVDTGVHPGYARPPVCLHGCAERLRRDHRDEEVRHRHAMRNCHGARTCTIVERATHREREAALAAMWRACRRSCYGEGGGAGGR